MIDSQKSKRGRLDNGRDQVLYQDQIRIGRSKAFCYLFSKDAHLVSLQVLVNEGLDKLMITGICCAVDNSQKSIDFLSCSDL